MKRIMILAFTFSAFLVSYGQKQYLKTTDFNVSGSLQNYYLNLNTLLFNELPDKPYARFMVVPSFSKEYAFSLEEVNDKFFIISTTFSESYWRAKSKKGSLYNT